MRRSRRAHCVSGIPNRQPFEKFAAARFGLLPIEVRTGEGRLREPTAAKIRNGDFPQRALARIRMRAKNVGKPVGKRATGLLRSRRRSWIATSPICYTEAYDIYSKRNFCLTKETREHNKV